MATWQQYIDQILHKLDQKSNEWKTTDICSAAAIYGLDGYPWAFSPNFPELCYYDFDLDDGFGTVEKIKVDEIDCAIEAGKGNRNPGRAGIRLGKQKYMLTVHSSDDMTTQLKKMGGGGAAIAITNKAFIVGLWEKETMQSDGLVQSGTNCEMAVLAIANHLKKNDL